MLFRLLKTINTTNLTRVRCSYQKFNQLIVCTGSQRYCSTDKHDKASCYKVKDVRKKICVSSRKPIKPVCYSGKKALPCPCPAPGFREHDHSKPPKKPADCTYDIKAERAKYRRIGLLGLLLTAAALGYLMFFNKSISFTKADKRKKNEKLLLKKYSRPKPECKVPATGDEFPKHVPYLLIGGGTASFAAFRAIKSADPKAKVLVISNECHNPYMRPPLSKEMWFTDSKNTSSKLIFKQWNGTERSLYYEPDDFYTPIKKLETNENGGVTVSLGWSVKKVDAVKKIVYLEDDTQIKYDKCLLATGASPKVPGAFSDAKPTIQEKITLFREVFDFQELNEICNTVDSVAIIGGGFLGSELACALGCKARQRSQKTQLQNMRIYQIFRESGNMARVLPEYLSCFTTEKVRNEGVDVRTNTEVEDISLSNNNKSLVLHLNNGHRITVDHVIVALGVDANTQLAEESSLEVDPELGGYLVNAEMEARTDLYAAGDCSCFYDVKLGRRRVEHHDHAVVSGRLAGENMTGARKPYLHQSMFWSDLGPDVGYEAIGIVDSSLPTVGVFAKATSKDTPKAITEATNENLRCESENENENNNKEIIKCQDYDLSDKPKHDCRGEDYGKGIIFYLRNDTVVGIVLWNVFNRMSIARQVLKDQRKYEDLNEVAKLFNIHESDTASAGEEAH